MAEYQIPKTFAAVKPRIDANRRADLETLLKDQVASALGVSKQDVLKAPPSLVANSLRNAVNGVIQQHTKTRDEHYYVLFYAKRRFKEYFDYAKI